MIGVRIYSFIFEGINQKIRDQSHLTSMLLRSQDLYLRALIRRSGIIVHIYIIEKYKSPDNSSR